jgi:hypothetical protein
MENQYTKSKPLKRKKLVEEFIKFSTVFTNMACYGFLTFTSFVSTIVVSIQMVEENVAFYSFPYVVIGSFISMTIFAYLFWNAPNEVKL